MKAAPEGVAMVISAIRPKGPGMMGFYQASITEFNEIADALGRPKFSELCKRDLATCGLDPQAIDLLESVTRIGNFANVDYYRTNRKNRSRLLLVKYGERQPRGKRTRPGMLEFVAEMTPVLMFYGFEFKTGGRSRLVTVLQRITAEIGLDGDPRDELRRLKRESNKELGRFYRVFAEAIAPRPRVAP